MLLQIAGTSGSGKSFLMRAFIDWARANAKEFAEKDGGYLIKLGKQSVYVLGKYDVPTGGCDTIRDVTKIYKLLEQLQEIADHVLFEGLFVMNQTRGPRLADKHGLNYVVLQLVTPLATCLASINARRAARGAEALENKKNTQDNYKRALSYCSRMRDAGARVIKISREEGLPKLQELLGC